MKKRYSCELCGLVLLTNVIGILWFPAQVNGQDNSLLRVIVFSDEDGISITGANLVLYEMDETGETDGITDIGASDRDGFYEFRDIEPGTYLLRVSYIGFESQETELDFERGDRMDLRIHLSPTVEMMDDLIVEGKREIASGEAGVRRFSAEDITRIPTPSPGGDLATYLQTVPGVVTAGDRGGELFIRGGTPDQNLVMVDNLPIIKPFHISNLFSAFSDQTVRNVDLYAGGFPAEYLGGTSSVIDVHLSPGNMRQFEGAAAISPVINSLHAEGPIEKDRKSISVTARKSAIDQYGSRLTGETVPYNFNDVVSRFTYQGDDITCSVTGVYTSDRGLINPDRNVEQFWSNRVLGGRCLYFDTSLDHIIEFTAGYTAYRSSEGPPSSDERSSDTDQLYISIDLKRDIFDHTINYGFGLNYGDFKTRIDERFTSFDSFHSTLPVARLYLSTEIHGNDRLTFQPGLGSQFSSNSSISFELRFRMLYRPYGTDNRELSLAFGKYNQMISGIRDERDAGTVFTVLKPVDVNDPLPSALHGIVAFQQRFGRNITTNIESYVISHKNIPVSKWSPEARLELETALADGSAYGFDVRIEYDKNPLYFAVGYGWSQITYDAAAEDLGAWINEPVFSYSPPHDQRHILDASLSFEMAGFVTGARWFFGSGRPFTQVYGFDLAVDVPVQHPTTSPGTARTLFSRPYGARQPVQHQLDISVKKPFQIVSNLSVTAEVGAINTYDRKNIFFLDLNTLQRVDQTPLLPYFSIITNFN